MLKRFCALFALFFLLINLNPIPASAQLKLTSAGLNSGQGVITSGLDASIIFNSSTNRLYVRGNSARFYAKYGWKFADNHVRLDASGGAFKLLPWVGPQLTFSGDIVPGWEKGGSITNFTWAGLSFGDDGNGKLNMRNTGLMFWQNATFVSLGAISLSYSALDFKVLAPERVLHLIGAKYSVSINSQFKATGGITIEPSEPGTVTPLWNIGVSYTP